MWRPSQIPGGCARVCQAGPPTLNRGLCAQMPRRFYRTAKPCSCKWLLAGHSACHVLETLECAPGCIARGEPGAGWCVRQCRSWSSRLFLLLSSSCGRFINHATNPVPSVSLLSVLRCRRPQNRQHLHLQGVHLRQLGSTLQLLSRTAGLPTSLPCGEETPAGGHLGGGFCSKFPKPQVLPEKPRVPHKVFPTHSTCLEATNKPLK